MGHTEACRARIMEELEKIGDQRVEREQERLFEYLEEEENKRKRSKKEGPSQQGSQPSSSSGAAGAEVPRSSGGVPLDQAPTKRKAEGENHEQIEKKSKGEEDERGIKSSIDEWEDFAKRLESNAETRAGESKDSGSGMDVSYADVIKEIGAVACGESDVKFDEMAIMLVDELHQDQGEEYYDAISGEAMDSELIKKAREIEMETYKKHGVYEKVTIEECWRATGRAPVGEKWVDTNKGD